MLYYNVGLIALAVLYLLVVAIYISGKEGAFKLLAVNSLSGLLALILLKLTAVYLQIAVNINIISVTGALALGLPGVAAYFLIDFLFL